MEKIVKTQTVDSNEVICKRLSKHSTAQLENKIKDDNFSSPDEKQIAIEVLNGRKGVASKIADKIKSVKKPEPVEKVSDSVELPEEKTFVAMRESKKESVAKEVVIAPVKTLLSKEQVDDITDKIDKIYALKVKANNIKVGAIVDGVEEYNELSEEQVSALDSLYKEVFQLKELRPVKSNKEIMSKKETKVKTEKSVKEPKNGVISNIQEIISTSEKPVTINEIFIELQKRFPEKVGDSMLKTVKAQIGGSKQPCRMEREKSIVFNVSGEGKTKAYSLKK